MNISISNKAYNHLRSIAEFSAKISTNYSNKVIQSIYSTIYVIKDAPYIGRYVPEISNKHYRERICGKYRIIYVVSEKHNTVFIRYIISEKQNSHLFFEVHKNEIFNFLNRLFI